MPTFETWYGPSPPQMQVDNHDLATCTFTHAMPGAGISPDMEAACANSVLCAGYAVDTSTGVETIYVWFLPLANIADCTALLQFDSAATFNSWTPADNTWICTRTGMVVPKGVTMQFQQPIPVWPQAYQLRVTNLCPWVCEVYQDCCTQQCLYHPNYGLSLCTPSGCHDTVCSVDNDCCTRKCYVNHVTNMGRCASSSCSNDGSSCSSNSECCSGNCVGGACGAFVSRRSLGTRQQSNCNGLGTQKPYTDSCTACPGSYYVLNFGNKYNSHLCCCA